MLKIIGQKIMLTRGDTANIDLSIYQSSKEKYILTGNDKVYFTVKENHFDTAFKFQKTVDFASVLPDGTIYVKISPIDTQNLEFKEYIYDVELKTSAGDVYTVIPPSPFIVTAEVTYPINEG